MEGIQSVPTVHRRGTTGLATLQITEHKVKQFNAGASCHVTAWGSLQSENGVKADNDR